MANIKKLDPGASPLHFFGAELRRMREAAGLTLEQLGSIVFLTGSMIGQVETAAKVPKKEHIPRLDAALGANGLLVRIWKMALRNGLPVKHQQVAELESTAKRIFAFQPQLVHGLLQTEEYTRAVLGVLERENLDEWVDFRMKRQRILEREKPPLYWVVLSEAVLHLQVGGKGVMRKQLARLLSYRYAPRVQIQVLPFSAGAHTGVGGAFNLYSYEDQQDVTFSENYGPGEATADPEEFEMRSLHYDLLRATALSPEGSAELIARVMEERYEDHPESGPSAMA